MWEEEERAGVGLVHGRNEAGKVDRGPDSERFCPKGDE